MIRYFILLCFFLVASSFSQQLVGVGSDGVYEINPLTGLTNHRITMLGIEGATDALEDGLIYARIPLLDLLILVNLDSWSFYAIGSMIPSQRDLACDEARHLLYGTDRHTLNLINKDSGLVHYVGDFHSTTSPVVIAPMKGLDYDVARDVLIGIDQTHLWRINKDTADCTLVGAHLLPGLEDIYCDPITGKYWGVSGPISELVEIDPLTGGIISTIGLDAGPFTGIASYGNRDTTNDFCIAIPNSTGVIAETLIYGHGFVSTGSLLEATISLPVGQPSLLIASRAWSFIPPSGNTVGYQCVIGNLAIFRNQLAFAPYTGRVFLELDITNFPTRPVSTSVQVGETWYFQSWYRDRVGEYTTNFSLPSEVLFQ